MNREPLIQLSSIFMILLCSELVKLLSSRGTIFIAYYWRRTRQRSELQMLGCDLALRYPSLSCFRITVQTWRSVTSRPLSCWTISRTCLALTIGWWLASKRVTTALMASRSLSAYLTRSRKESSFSGCFTDSLTSWHTRLVEILYFEATSF